LLCRGSVSRGSRLWPILALLWIASSVGCGSSLATVSGTVTLDGKPVDCSPELYGIVNFYHENGGGVPATGTLNGIGQYTLSSGSHQTIEPGTYLVGVSIKKILPPDVPGGQTRPQQLSPPKYGTPGESGFKAEVKPGSNTFDFALQSN
jgi:hypothetical protein